MLPRFQFKQVELKPGARIEAVGDGMEYEGGATWGVIIRLLEKWDPEKRE